MALDEALALSAPLTGSYPTLRIYKWKRPAVSIGYNQQAAGEIDLGFCRSQGIDLVRRPTGGRAVYHDQELTYALVVPRDFFQGNTVLDSYGTLAPGFLECLNILGVTGELITSAQRRVRGRRFKRRNLPETGNKTQPACFLAPSWYEIAVKGKKIIGSAQRRLRSCVLQHGSFLLAIDWERFLHVFCQQGKSSECNERELVTNLEEVSGRRIGFEKAAEALIEGFETVFGSRMFETDPSNQEEDLARKLVKEKYGSVDWNINRIDRFRGGY